MPPLPAQVRFHKALLAQDLAWCPPLPGKTGKEGLLAPQEPPRDRHKGRMVGWSGEAGGRARLKGELANIVEAPLAVVVPPGAVVRGLRHAVLERAAVRLVGAERVRRGAGPGAGLGAGGAVPGEEGHALAVLEEVEALGAPVVHTQPHGPVVGGKRRAQMASKHFHLLTIRRLRQASAPRHASRLRRCLSLEVAREQEALVAKAHPLQAACGRGGAEVGLVSQGRSGGGLRTARGWEMASRPPGAGPDCWGGTVGGVVRPE